MSSFFTLPASQAKRKRVKANNASRPTSKRNAPSRKSRDESISGSDISDNDLPAHENGDANDSDSEDEEYADEAPNAKRLRLAERYLANTQREVLDEAGFDAADVDKENLARRMGNRLQEDTAESRGKLYRWIADTYAWSKAERTQFRHHQKSVNGVAIAGEHIYTVGKDGMLVKWRLASTSDASGIPDSRRKRSRKPRKLITSRPSGKSAARDTEDHEGSVLSVAVSQDGKFVATGGADKRLIVWDSETLKPLKVFPQHRDSVTSLVFRRGTNQLFSASKDRTIKTWSLNELAYVETLFGHQDEVVDVSALAEEKCVSVGARDRTARLWKVVEESQLVFRGGGAPGRSKMRHTDDQLSSAEALEIERHHEGSTDRVACIDDETFVTGSDNGALSLWNVHKKKAVFTYPLAHGLDPPLPLDEVSAELNPDPSVLGKPLARWITALRAIPFSDTFVSGSWDGYVRVWKISSDKRRIEALGRIGCVETPIEQSLEQEGLSSDDLSSSAMKALKDGAERHGHVSGIINDLAITDVGERGKGGVNIIAAVGKSHRLGRWKEMKDGKNVAILFEVPLTQPDDDRDDIETSEHDVQLVPGVNGDGSNEILEEVA